MFVMPDAARAAGFVFRRAVEGRPKLIVVLGIWLYFFPAFLVNLQLLAAILSGDFGGLRGLVLVWLALAGATVCASMLYRVTRNYVTMTSYAHGHSR
jgi:hypothetical protein